MNGNPFLAYAARIIPCSLGDGEAILNPRPSAPYKQLTYGTFERWDATRELYGHVAQLILQDTVGLDDLLNGLQTWVRNNTGYFVVHTIVGQSVGAVAFRLPILNGYEPKVYRPVT